MASHVLAERHELAELLHEVGPDAPTLCTGWDARLLLAHLVRRERSLLEVGARARLPLAGLAADKAMRAYAATIPYEELLTQLSEGAPPWSFFALPPAREAFNLLEYAIHLEDVRRVDAAVAPRPLSESRQRAIFKRLRAMAGLAMRATPVPVELRWTDGRSIRVGPVGPSNNLVIVNGEPMELALVAYGRQRVARVSYSGNDAAIAKLIGAQLGVA
jgi:uncharacterized protein (TIGR03085 family)